jgi:hypothetical protein
VSQIVYQKHGLLVTAFHGGQFRGPCLQFDAVVSQLDADEARNLALQLNGWLAKLDAKKKG